MELGYIRKTETINMSRDQQIYEAKQIVLSLNMAVLQTAQTRPDSRDGENFRGLADAILMNMRYCNYILITISLCPEKWLTFFPRRLRGRNLCIRAGNPRSRKRGLP